MFCKLKHEIRREARAVPPDLLVQPPGADAVQAGELHVEHDALAAHEQDPGIDRPNRAGIRAVACHPLRRDRRQHL
jgi:hypothetical protein